MGFSDEKVHSVDAGPMRCLSHKSASSRVSKVRPEECCLQFARRLHSRVAKRSTTPGDVSKWTALSARQLAGKQPT
jgi:hypothetical protein